MKRILWFIPALLLGFCVAEAEIVDRIVAKVNDDIITLTELNRVFKPYSDHIRSMNYSLDKERKLLFKAREEILNQLIDQKLTDQEIKRNNISVEDAEIDATIERIKEARMVSDEMLRESLKAEDMTMAEYRQTVREQILRTKLINLEIKSKIVITQAEIEDYYQQHQKEFGGQSQYHLHSILVRTSPNDSESERDAAREKMAAIRQEIEGGRPFNEVARERSDPPLAEMGGDIGMFSLDKVAPKLRAAIEGLSIGQMTPVIETDQGLQIFFVSEIVAGEGKSMEKVTAEIERRLFQQVVDTKFSAWLEDLKSRSFIKTIL